jgi:hypothetical protein
MYIRTNEGLGQIPMLYGSFAGTLGDSPLPPEIQSFLNRVKKNPQNYEALLITSSFDNLEPLLSDQLTFLSIPSEHEEKVIQTLQAIYKKHLGDSRFNKLVNNEKQLIQVVSKAFPKVIKELETEDVSSLEDILTDAALAQAFSHTTESGRNFVLRVLPTEITERVTNSVVPRTHYARLGKALLLIAEQRQKDKDAFKQRVKQSVERERKRILGRE